MESKGAGELVSKKKIDTARMKMYAPIMPGKTQCGHHCGERYMIIQRYPLGTYNLKHD